MKIEVKFHTPLRATGGRPRVVWPKGWPIPRVGEVVYDSVGTPLWVNDVCWYPHGNPRVGKEESFVYVVLGGRPR